MRRVLAGIVFVAMAAGCDPAAIAPAGGPTPTTGTAVDGEQPGTSGGPLQAPPPHGQILEELQVGQRFSDGWEKLRISGKERIVIENVKTLGGSPGLRQVDVLLAGDERKASSITSDRAFPPKEPAFGPLRQAIGANIRPKPGPRYPHWELVIGYEVTRPGIWKRDALLITYRVGGNTYTQRFPSELLACTVGVTRCTEP